MRAFWFIFLGLLLIHQDFWNWSSEEIIAWGMPVGLIYHAGFSIACSLLGVWAVCRAWPTSWEQYAAQQDETSEGTTEKNLINSSK